MLAALPEVKSVLGADVSEGMLGQFNKLAGTAAFLFAMTSAMTCNAAEEKEEVRSKLSSLKTSANPVEELKPHVGSKDLVVMAFVVGHLHPREAGYEVLRLSALVQSFDPLSRSSSWRLPA